MTVEKKAKKELLIIIPAYNEEKTIVHNVKSLLSQDYPKFEVIIVNNLVVPVYNTTILIIPNVSKIKTVNRFLNFTSSLLFKTLDKSSDKVFVAESNDVTANAIIVSAVNT